MLLTPHEMMMQGLNFLGIHPPPCARESTKYSDLFHKHYGSSTLVVASLWFDLAHASVNGECLLLEKEMTTSGLRQFLMAIYFLWVYPKNAELLASVFNVCASYCQGKRLWRWIEKIQAMKTIKITWPDFSEIFCLTVDGVDFKTWEPKHPIHHRDKGAYSPKFNHGGVKYELGVAVFQPKIVWTNGPFKAAVHDLTVFRAGLKQKIGPGKKVIADRGYRSDDKHEQSMLSLPYHGDSAELKSFKSRARCRHESVNGRIKNFRAMEDTFRHGKEKHKIAFEAVCVIVQYQMDNGAEVFQV